LLVGQRLRLYESSSDHLPEKGDFFLPSSFSSQEDWEVRSPLREQSFSLGKDRNWLDREMKEEHSRQRAEDGAGLDIVANLRVWRQRAQVVRVTQESVTLAPECVD
jgi:hypothetical protein